MTESREATHSASSSRFISDPMIPFSLGRFGIGKTSWGYFDTYAF